MIQRYAENRSDVNTMKTFFALQYGSRQVLSTLAEKETTNKLEYVKNPKVKTKFHFPFNEETKGEKLYWNIELIDRKITQINSEGEKALTNTIDNRNNSIAMKFDRILNINRLNDIFLYREIWKS